MKSGIGALLFLVIAAGEAAAQSDPATMAPDTWLAVPNSHMRTVAPTNGQFAGTWGVGGPSMVLAAWGGVAFLAEDISLRLVLAAALILGGIALAISGRRKA